MEFNELIQERFSCRALSDAEIPHAAMDRIIEAARHASRRPPSTSSRSRSGRSRARRHGQSSRRRQITPSVRVFSSLSAESTKTHGCGNTTDATSPTWMPASSQPTSCSPFTMRDCARRGSDISTRQNSRRHSLRWRTMTSSPSSPSATPRRRASPPPATRSANLLWRLWKCFELWRIPREPKNPPPQRGIFHP